MEFIKIAYCVTVPLILLYAWLPGKTIYKGWAINLLAVSNLLLIGNTLFLLRQLWAFYQLSKAFPQSHGLVFQPAILSTIHLLLIIVMPFLSLIGSFRRNRWFSLLVLVVFFAFYPVNTWNLYDLGAKIMQYICLLCTAYALCWLFKRLPYQSSPS
jgi:hypothetical protein